MQNEIQYFSKMEVSTCIEEQKNNPSLHVVELNGAEIKSIDELYARMDILFRLPYPTNGNIDGYLDWMRDLEWLKKDGFLLVIYDYKKLLPNDKKSKTIFIEDIKEIVLPWWQEEIEHCQVEGKSKPFNVYLVD